MERVWLLIEGTPAALDLTLSLNAFKEEQDKTIVGVTLTLQNIWIEYTNELV